MPVDRTNQLRERLEEGTVALGVETKTRSPVVIETLGDLEFDFVWIDLEHAGPSPFDGPTLEQYQRASEAAGTSLLARVPSADPHAIRKVMDAGIRSILVPRVETAREVRRAVRTTRFSYRGEPGGRGVGTARGSRWGRDLNDHAAREDDSALLGVMIENRTAAENLGEILSVPELGFVFVGPADLSVSLGAPLDTDDAIVREYIDQIISESNEAGVPVGRIANDRREIEAAITDGCTLLRVGSDLDAMYDAYEGLGTEFS